MMRKMVATLMVGGLVEGTLCCAPGDDGWWLEAKKLAADIKRRAVARVLTDEDSGEAGEVLGMWRWPRAWKRGKTANGERRGKACSRRCGRQTGRAWTGESQGQG